MRFFLYLFLLPLFIYPQKGYEKNDHVKINTRLVGNNYVTNYSFKDHFNDLNNLKFSFNQKKMDNIISKLGIPYKMFDRYHSTKEIEIQRDLILNEGMFMKENNKLVLDYNTVISFYRPYCKIISNSLIDLLKSKNEDTRLNRIEIAMKFIQDIPYGLPKKNRKTYTNGCLAPIDVLIKGYGDCDSKTLFFICILSYMINPDDILIVKGENHMLSAVRDDVKKTSSSDFFRYGQKKYYICETAGPGRFLFGQKSLTRKKYSLEPLIIN